MHNGSSRSRYYNRPPHRTWLWQVMSTDIPKISEPNIHILNWFCHPNTELCKDTYMVLDQPLQHRDNLHSRLMFAGMRDAKTASPDIYHWVQKFSQTMRNLGSCLCASLSVLQTCFPQHLTTAGSNCEDPQNKDLWLSLFLKKKP